MGLRDFLSKAFTPTVAKGIPADPASREQAMHSAGMDSNVAFSPGRPLAPHAGYSVTPRAHDFPTGYNIAARPRHGERVSFQTLRNLVDSYDVAQMCIWHRIDSVRSLEWSLAGAPGYEGGVEDYIDLATAILKRPDKELRWQSWLAKYLYDVLAFDAGALYRIRNVAGQVVGLQVVDGTTIAPLLDEWGRRPRAERPFDPEPPAYQQYAQGVPWSQLGDSDLIYEPFRPTSESPYGKAPLEAVLLNANTDLRFQLYYLQRFTSGNVPKAFATSPEGWTPGQISEFQEAWDAEMYGDQEVLSQIKWVPPGSEFAWSDEKEFDDTFSLFMMRKTCAAYHVVPADLGFTEDVNRATSETQVDVQFRIGDLPLIQHVEGVVTEFLQADLHVPLIFRMDTGQEKEDRLATAQADKIYIDAGVISISEARERVFGLNEPNGVQIPRIYSTSKGPIPLGEIISRSGATDPGTGAPVLPVAPATVALEPVPTILASAPTPDGGLLAPGVLAPMPAPVAKETTAGITSGTGITGSPLIGDDEEQGLPVPVDDEVTKAGLDELGAFRRFQIRRARGGQAWRDFEFKHINDVWAHRLNDAGRAAFRKSTGQLVAAGLVVRAADTGRVLMLQRALDETDPASGLDPGADLADEALTDV